MKTISKFMKDEDGQAIVMVALFMAVLITFGALVMDGGMVRASKTIMQNAADAAALAGAQDFPDASISIDTAKNYAQLNGVEVLNTTVTTPYEGDSTKLEVICTENVKYSFSQLFGLKDIDVTARAVAQNNSKWDGEALTFLNLDDDYEVTDEIVAWEKTGPGDFESINNYEIENADDPDTLYFKIDYMSGVELKKGTVATIKQEVGYVYDQHYPNSPVYVLSLSSAVMNSGQVLLTDGTYRSLHKLENKDIVDPSQIVLLECIFHDYDFEGKTLYLTVLDVYDISNNEFPPDYVNPDGGSVKLVE